MRSKLLILLALTVLPAQALAAEPPPLVRGSFVEDLSAEFTVRVGGRVELFKMVGSRSTDLQSGKRRLSGSAFRGTCAKGVCSLRSLAIKVIRFDIADDYSHAVLRLKDAKHTHHLRFTAGNPYPILGPGLYGGDTACGGKDFGQHLGNWNAQAEGRMFGRRVSTATEANQNNRESESIETSVLFRACPP